MIVLRPMRNEEYPAYLDYFIPDYAAEISANYALSPAAALARRSAKSPRICLTASIPAARFYAAYSMTVTEQKSGSAISGTNRMKKCAPPLSAILYLSGIAGARVG